ncbi:MAG TPA: dTDP-4-dehydrorhamnose reductase [Spirochaetia bacterium]|nr:dTDP-4-dehydrorhamnose reductase [Spirochaetia bacterium]
MKIVVVGAKGMLGSELARTLACGNEVISWDVDEIDVTDRAGALARLEAVRPGLIVNAAAMVDVEACEKQPEAAWKVNAVGAQNLALAARALSADYLLVSSDYVFDGAAADDYDECSAPNPVNHYGRSKLAGERLACAVWSRTYIARTSWLFGHRPNNYVDRVLSAADRDGVVRMGEDQLESPTYVPHVAAALAALVSTGAHGTYHVTSRGACTRREFARYVLNRAGRSTPTETLADPGAGRRARRPGRTVLDCRLFELVTGHPLPAWQAGVDQYLTREPAARVR